MCFILCRFAFVKENPLQLKKSLGQHFLHDKNILQKISAAVGDVAAYSTMIEIGPGQGALTDFLIEKNHPDFHIIELDDRWAAYHQAQHKVPHIHHADFLKFDLAKMLRFPTIIVGNFPYNISTQIIFKIIDHRDMVTTVVGMFQKEVAQRIAASPNTKAYGVMSILAQAYYDTVYLFDVPPGCFSPPPKVMSGVIALYRKKEALQCDEILFKKIVKQSFTMRRKTLRNSLKAIIQNTELLQDSIFDKRPEQLSVKDFEGLTNFINLQKNG